MSLKAFAVACTLLGGASNVWAQDFQHEMFPIWKEIESTAHTIWKVVAGVNFVLLEKDCYINANGTDTVVHCGKEDSMISFMIENTIPTTSKYIPSLLIIQWETTKIVLETLIKSQKKEGWVLERTPPYKMKVYENKTRICQEIINPSMDNTIWGVFVDIDRDGNYDAISTGTCSWIKQWEANVSLDRLIVPWYSITLPQISYDCADFGSIYSCRSWIKLPLNYEYYSSGNDTITVQPFWNPRVPIERKVIYETYTSDINDL